MHHLTNCGGPPPSLLLALQQSLLILCILCAFTALPYGLQGEAVVFCWSVKSIINHLLSHSNLQSSQQHRKKDCMLWQEWFPLKKIFSVFLKVTLISSFFHLSLSMYFFVFLVLLPGKNVLAFTLARFLLKAGCLQERREKPMIVKLRHQYTKNSNVFRVDFVYLWYRKTGNQNAQFKIKTLC